MRKWQVVEMFKNVPEEIKSLTVGALVDRFSKEIKEDEKSEEDANLKVCLEFEDSYLKIKEIDGLFGRPEVNLFHIKRIKTGSYTTEHKRMYDVSGTRLNFSDGDYSIRELRMGDSYDSFMADQLNSAEKITEEDFETARRKLESIQEICKNMLK